ncbi:hypothetical protein [Halopseudomonas oceani]|uniref:hypothetical protein n=1 Tax=Halopseudomonas oceani TaxID=1708783 RepID=UPI002AA75020|nr:hypothetical protein [Halopseudomonas oceani]
MQVRILDDGGEVIWSQSPELGMTALSHRKNGRIDEILAVLSMATERAKEEKLLPVEQTGSDRFSKL